MTITPVSTFKPYRKGIPRGLGMRPRDSVSERFPGYIESSVKMKKHPIQFLRRATQSGKSLVCQWTFRVNMLCRTCIRHGTR